jgi:methylmalonyl-CoA/ethylmalonyl-CoA epimerase
VNLPGQLHHVGWAVNRAEHAALTWRGLGYEPDPSLPDQPDPEFGVTLQFLRRPNDPVRLELVMPTRPDSVVAALLERSGPGPYHLGYRVDDLEAAARQLRGLGFRPVTRRHAAPALAGRLIQFFRHPAVGLVELIQWPMTV